MQVPRALIIKAMTLTVGLMLCGFPEFALGMQEPAPTSDGQSAAQPAQQNGTTIDPSKGPLQPVPSQNPQSPSTPPPNGSTEITAAHPAAPVPQPKSLPPQQPLGAATAEGVPTVGGGASRPAGAAIAPAKQGQRRSLLLKLGLIAAVGVAGGTVYALSKGTSSHP
jgi:hypothetical protein